ncbi:MAG: 30S ribosomal protein S18 [Parcubacteria group bacterium]|nr:30S ribosomal protein S18 [Parcubacteria group bacterium]
MHCQFCQKGKKLVDFKETASLTRILSAGGKIKSRTKTGLCAQHQRNATKAVKRARYMGLLPYTKE